MQKSGVQDNISHDDDDTCLKSVAEKFLAQDKLETKKKTLYLNNWVE